QSTRSLYSLGSPDRQTLRRYTGRRSSFDPCDPGRSCRATLFQRFVVRAPALDATRFDDARAGSHRRTSKNIHYRSSDSYRLRRRATANQYRRSKNAHRGKTQSAGEDRNAVETKRTIKTQTGLPHLREPRSKSGATDQRVSVQTKH